MILSAVFRRCFTRHPCPQILNPFGAGCRSYAILLNYPKRNLNFREATKLRPYCASEQLKEKWVTVTFLRADGLRFQRKGKVGSRILELIQTESDPDLDGYGLCFGNTQCATCQLIFPRELYDKLPKPVQEEADLLNFSNISERSRCGCCVEITEDMDGMVLEVPDR